MQPTDCGPGGRHMDKGTKCQISCQVTTMQKGMVFLHHKCHLVKLRLCHHPKMIWPALKVPVIRPAIVSQINSSFLAEFISKIALL